MEEPTIHRAGTSTDATSVWRNVGPADVGADLPRARQVGVRRPAPSVAVLVIDIDAVEHVRAVLGGGERGDRGLGGARGRSEPVA